MGGLRILQLTSRFLVIFLVVSRKKRIFAAKLNVLIMEDR